VHCLEAAGVRPRDLYREIAEQNLRANPEGLANDFAHWIEAMY
jgi:hypothetical protein